MKVLVAQLCSTLCNSMNCSLPGSSVHGILQARILEWVGIPFSRGSSQPRDWIQVSWITGRFFYCLRHQEDQYTLYIKKHELCSVWICCSFAKSYLTQRDSMNCRTQGSFVFYYLGVCSDSCPLSQWCYLTISSSAFSKRIPSPFAFSLP